VHIRLFHLLQELTRVRRERLHVAALTLGVDRVERERRLARARQPGDDDELASRNLEVDGLEDVLARAPADDAIAVHGPTMIRLPAGVAQRRAARASSLRAHAAEASPRNFRPVYPSGYTDRQWRSSGARSRPTGFARSLSHSSLLSS